MYPSVIKANEALTRAQAKSLDHEITVLCTYMTNDDADFHAECTCGWKGRDWRDSSSPHKDGQKHLKEVTKNG